jgi:primary-amine oxidase
MAMNQQQQQQQHHHPLDPLSVDEIRAAAAAVKQHHHHLPSAPEDEEEEKESLRFVAISLKEPSRSSDAVQEGAKQRQQQRAAEVVVLHPATGLAYEYVVNLMETEKEKVTGVIDDEADGTIRQVPKGRQPLLTPDDCDLAESIVQASAEMQTIVLERYGIEDITRIACDPWSVNLADETDLQELVHWRDDGVPGRLVQTFLYHRQYGNGLEDNHYAHPIDIVPVVDLNARKIVTIHGLDRPGPPPKIPSASVQYHRNLLSTNSYLQSVWREDCLRALQIVQPDGPSFTVSTHGNLVAWQGWTFRVGFNYREGLVLHNVSYQGRSILRRGSLVEMAVPYADPHPPFQRKCAFDVGDYVSVQKTTHPTATSTTLQLLLRSRTLTIVSSLYC